MIRSNGRARADGQAAQVVKTVDARYLIPSPENAVLYRERTTKDGDFARLVESVQREGVQAPLLVSRDQYIVSGHQRREAAIVAKRYMVPVIFLTISRAGHTTDEWLAILREQNCGRERTFDELVREKLLDIDPDEAIAHIVDDQIERTRVRVACIDIGDKEMRRYGISQHKSGMVEAILEVLRDLREYLPVSLRAIHYRLLVKTFCRNSKTDTPYKNDLASYKDLSDVATRLRIEKRIPWDSICDETRPVTRWGCWRNAAAFIAEKSEQFLRGYARDLLQSQAQHFEIVAEKLTVQNFIKPVAGRYRMPVVIMRGNSGIDARHQRLQPTHSVSSTRGIFASGVGYGP